MARIWPGQPFSRPGSPKEVSVSREGEGDGVQASNPEGDAEIYAMNSLDGTGKRNLTNNTAGDYYAEWGR